MNVNYGCYIKVNEMQYKHVGNECVTFNLTRYTLRNKINLDKVTIPGYAYLTSQSIETLKLVISL